MSTQFLTKTKVTPQSTPSFTPVRSNVLQRRCACGSTPGPDGECAECRRKRMIGMSPRLVVNQPGDRSEQEADRMADQVMSRPATNIERRVSAPTGGTIAPPIVHEVLGSSGQPLDANTRASMEPRFGHDFSQVRVHTDERAAQSARAVDALAYTVGQDVVFGAGLYAPETMGGKKLLAHELPHTIQQRSQGDRMGSAVMRQAQGKAQVKTEFEDCTGTQPNQIQAATEDARKALGRATAVIGSAYGKPAGMKPNHKKLLIDHFHTTSRDDLRTILGKYLSVQRAFEAGLKFQCETTCPKGKGTVVCGYAYNTQLFGGFGPIHICFDPAGCDFATTPAVNQSALIIHEAAHRHAGIDDKVYQWDKAKYSALSSNDAMDNADSYAWFATLV